MADRGNYPGQGEGGAQEDNDAHVQRIEMAKARAG